MNKNKHYLLNQLKGFENIMGSKVVYIYETDYRTPELYTFEMKINPTYDRYTNTPFIEVHVTYNFKNGTFKIKAVGTGARLHGKVSKESATMIIEGCLQEGLKHLQGDTMEADWLTEQHLMNELKQHTDDVHVKNEFDYNCSHVLVTVAEKELLLSTMIEKLKVVTLEDETYIVGNRSFTSYDQAVEYCIGCDWDTEMITSQTG